MKKVIIIGLAILATFSLCNAAVTLFWESPTTGYPGVLYKYGADKIKYVFMKNASGTGNTTFYDAENSFTFVGAVPDTLCRSYFAPSYINYAYFDVNHDNRPELIADILDSFQTAPLGMQFIDIIDGAVVWQCLGSPAFMGYIGVDTTLKMGIYTGSGDNKLRIYDLGVSGSTVSGTPSSPAYNSRTTIKNAPNPFRETTNIRFALSKTSTVRLDVYNQIGQKITTLTDGKLNSGEHVIPWNANGVASGVYFYRLIVDGNATTEKTIIIK